MVRDGYILVRDSHGTAKERAAWRCLAIRSIKQPVSVDIFIGDAMQRELAITAIADRTGPLLRRGRRL